MREDGDHISSLIGLAGKFVARWLLQPAPFYYTLMSSRPAKYRVYVCVYKGMRYSGIPDKVEDTFSKKENRKEKNYPRFSSLITIIID